MGPFLSMGVLSKVFSSVPNGFVLGVEVAESTDTS